VHFATDYSYFEIIYSFCLTPFDLIHLFIDERNSLDRNAKTHVVKTLYESVQWQIQKKNEQHAFKTNKGRKRVVIEPDDWIWMHIHNERFPEYKRSKLMSWVDGPFQILERINDDNYKVGLPGEYDVTATFHIFNLSLFDVGDNLRLDPFEERGDDAI